VRFSCRRWGGNIPMGRPRRLLVHKGNGIPCPGFSAIDSVFLFVSLSCGAILVAVAVGVPRCPWIGWLGLFPILTAIRFLTPAKASISGIVWSLSYCLALYILGVTSFVRSYVSISAILVLPALYLSLGASVTRRFGFQPVFLALGWVILEYVFTFVGIRHGLLGLTTETVGGVHLVMQAFGYIFVAFLIVLINAELLSIICGICVKIVSRKLSLYPYRSNAPVFICVLGLRPLAAAGPHRPRAPPIIASCHSWRQ
jgi:apolipoprotein N-acyltransferase